MKEISGVWRTRGFEAFHGRRRKFYTSESFELPPGAAVTRIGWDAELAPKTWVRARMRCADTPVDLDRAQWTGPDCGNGWFDNGQPLDAPGPAGRWVQYRLALGATGSGNTPRVTEVSVFFA
jgi:hypothetical protein